MVNWDQIDTVLLDMDGTLLDLHFDNYFWLQHLPLRYAQIHGCTEAEATKKLTAMSERLHGSLQWYCLDHWSHTLALDIPALKREVSHLICMRPQTPDFLNWLKEENKAAIVVTNAHPKALSLKLEASGLGLLVDHCISSHDFELAKENAGFWPKLAAEHGFNYNRSLFIDDSLNVLRRARAEGLVHTLQMLHPDSQQPPRAESEFPGIHHFDEIMR